ncbi:acyl-CoA thioesterase II [Angustibacter sp. Root456]|uniref:acyl-CoA thioesterase n=1 Tax=Angustibacter sp. Root456 TaxID=1736539 RepID=UPI0006FC0510|nr:acyl-CoA thioesterase domain-containing protein [Angustibacter sp. Root456]KQX62818.1 hypothetical protein ASD06_12410 [Angustibacter sp. Root456]
MSATTVSPALGALLGRLDLVADGPDRFVSSGDHEGVVRLFGGQVAAQALAAAGRTVAPGRHVHSLHVSFLRPGDLHAPLRLDVTRLKEGRAYDVRRVDVTQQDALVLTATASFHVDEPGPEWSQGAAADWDGTAPADVDDVDALPRWEEQFAGRLDRLSPLWRRSRPMDLRYVGTPPPLDDDLAPGSRCAQRVYVRADGPLPDDELMHACLLVYATDASLLETAVLPQGVVWADGAFEGASLDHGLWFHQPPRADGWLRLDQRAVALGGGRGTAAGRLVDAEGRLVVTVVQEGSLRPVHGDTWMAGR